MKVGDIVRQGDKLVKIKGMKRSEMLGVVIGMIACDADPIPVTWRKWLGENQVTVLWANGKMTESMAQNSLEIISD